MEETHEHVLSGRIPEMIDKLKDLYSVYRCKHRVLLRTTFYVDDHYVSQTAKKIMQDQGVHINYYYR